MPFTYCAIKWTYFKYKIILFSNYKLYIIYVISINETDVVTTIPRYILIRRFMKANYITIFFSYACQIVLLNIVILDWEILKQCRPITCDLWYLAYLTQVEVLLYLYVFGWVYVRKQEYWLLYKYMYIHVCVCMCVSVCYIYYLHLQ